MKAPHHTTLLIKFCTLFFVWIGSILGVQAQQVLTKVNGGASWQTLTSGTDDQNITGCGLNGTNLIIGIENGVAQAVNLASLVPSNTDDQNITGCALNGTNLTIGIENGLSQTVSLASLRGNGIYGGSGTLLNNATVNFSGRSFAFTTGTSAPFRAGALYLFGSQRVGITNNSPSYALYVAVNDAAKPTSSVWKITSDARLKDIVGSYDKGLQEILQLNPITYHYKDVGNKVFPKEVKETLSIGFTAQEVRKVFPESVFEDEEGYLSLDVHAVNVAYVNAIKELHAAILMQKAKNQQLRQNLVQLKKLHAETKK